MERKQIIHSTYVIDIPAPKVKHGDIDADYDRACEDGTRRKRNLSIDDKVILAVRKVTRWREFAPAPSNNPRNTMARQRAFKIEMLVDALMALDEYPLHGCEPAPKTPMPIATLSIMTIKRILQGDARLTIRQELDNTERLERLHGLGLIGKDQDLHYCANIKQGCRDIVRPTHTNKPDGVSKSQNKTIANALKKDYEVLMECHVKREGKPTATVYNVVGIFHGSKETFYILRCPVTGGTFGRTLENIYIPMAVS